MIYTTVKNIHDNNKLTKYPNFNSSIQAEPKVAINEANTYFHGFIFLNKLLNKSLLEKYWYINTANSAVTVPIAAPTTEYLGISIKFSTKSITAPKIVDSSTFLS